MDELKDKIAEAYMKEDVGGASQMSGSIAAAAPENCAKIVVPSMCISEDKKEKEESLLEKRLADRKAKMAALTEMTDKMEQAEFNASLEEKKAPKVEEAVITKSSQSIEERLAARKAKLAEKEIVYTKPEPPKVKEPDKYVSNARKYYEPQEFANGKGDGTDHKTGYSGPSDYEKQRKEWQKRRYSRFDPKRDKTTEGETFFDGPNYNPIGRTDFDKRFDNGTIDDFLAWWRSREDDKPLYRSRKNGNLTNVDYNDHLMFDDEGDDEPVKGKKAKVKESFLRGRETEIMTVGALKKLLTKLPDSTKVQYGDYDDGVYEGIRINYSDGSSGTDPHFYIVF